MLAGAPARAHSGPPFPVLQDRAAGPYRLALWTDPDATDDRTPGGRFWVIVAPPAAGTRVSLVLRALDRPGTPEQRAAARSDPKAPERFFAAVVLDHEGPWSVAVDVAGPAGEASAEARVDATYDARPSPATLPFLVLPFLLVGGLWLRGLLARRRA